MRQKSNSIFLRRKRLTPRPRQTVLHGIMSASCVIRPAAESDLIAINDIYNHYVLHCTCTYQEEPERMEDRRFWFEHHGARHPIVVAEANGQVAGWGSLSPYHPRSAYRFTVENSIYVHPEHQQKGIGSLLLRDLIERARGIGHHVMLAGIDTTQTGSIALHTKFHFEKVAHFKQVGFKFGRWLDVIYMQLFLGRPH